MTDEAAITNTPRELASRETWRRHVRVSQDVFTERYRQIHDEGYSTAADDAYQAGELCLAAAAYLLSAAGRGDEAAVIWPFASQWKPSDPRRDMIRAAALCLAEIERLDRLPR